jgi:hypothetical protein
MIIVRWLLFWEPNQNAKTKIAVFPSAKHVAAPYPVNCRISCFNNKLVNEMQPVMLDGPKVNQPSEIFIEELFPIIPEVKSSIRGILIELLPTRRSLDLSLSRCLVDRIEGECVSRYVPWQLPSVIRPTRIDGIEEDPILQEYSKQQPVHISNDRTLSIVGINFSQDPVSLQGKLKSKATLVDNVSLNFDSGECQEYSLPLHNNPSITNGKCILEITNELNPDLAVYLVERKRGVAIQQISTL